MIDELDEVGFGAAVSGPKMAVVEFCTCGERASRTAPLAWGMDGYG